MTLPELNVDELLEQLTVKEKIDLLAGRDVWHTVANKRLGIPSIRTSDGPNGVRGIYFFEGTPSSCFPGATALGASFDNELLERVGSALADECIAKGVHVLLAPTINIQRSPLGGRGFESYSEDPELSGTLAKYYVKGLQDKGIAATIKHFVANDQEFERMSMSSEVSERALREIYLRAFEIPLRESEYKPWAVMTAYNRMNGLHCSEDPRLLKDILRDEWKWSGAVMSDWCGTYSADASTSAGLDLEMPGPPVVRGAALQRALAAKKVTIESIDTCARNILELINKVRKSGIDEDIPEQVLDTPDIRQILRESSANGVVLLKNDENIMPIRKGIKKIAVIGTNAESAIISGGGSAALRASYSISPLDAIREQAKEIGAEVVYSRGGNAHKLTPLFGPELKTKDGKAGVDVSFYASDPSAGNVKPAHVLHAHSSHMFFNDNLPSTEVFPLTCWSEATGTFTPNKTDNYELGVAGIGKIDLYINNEKVVDNSTDPQPGTLWFNSGSEERTTVKHLEEGKQYTITAKLYYSSEGSQAAGTLSPLLRGGIRFGIAPFKSQEAFIEEALEACQGASLVLGFVGLNNDFESEGFDRPDMKLPESANAFMDAIASANENTVAVVQTGTPVELPWVNKVKGVYQAFYGGNEVGTGLADVLFGKHNPSAKLPLTIPVELRDNPSHLNFGGENGRVSYAEGVFVGYRHFVTTGRQPLYPFGKGLSYTSFAITEPHLESKGDYEVVIKVNVKNTGDVAGKEVIQLYVHDVESRLARPYIELKAYGKTKTLNPGESQEVVLNLNRRAFSYFDDLKGKWVIEAGEFRLLVATSSATEDVKHTLSHTINQSTEFI
ncbi:putative beta-glucosidase precursor [Wallemia mellicola]|uniref:beta-glucosidase n=1 Tax=Wallemia mellicola TaxID=1708541 RepID=A0A4T0TKN8_9BASI|nr:putative beta-glucosidase precursor [Wallemia mellicola]